MIRILLSCICCIALASCGAGSSGDKIESTQDGLTAGLLAAPITEAQAVQFLWKSSFGPTATSIARLRQLGYSRYIDEQLAKPAGKYNDYWLESSAIDPDGVLQSCKKSSTPDGVDICNSWGRGPRAMSILFLKAAVHDEDQLRMRVAWALSQILVVSNASPGNRVNYAMRLYQQLLRDHALGSYHSLLVRISKNPLMGDFLDLAGSTAAGPNQNYARELLQLFSVGTYLRQGDGQFMLDENGQRIENYNPQHIADFSRALTGWNYYDPSTYATDMIPTGSHDSSSKTLLNNQRIASGNSTEAELIAVIDNVIAHPSTAPNIARQLIQFLVTSNPSPAYVARVVKAWHSNSAGVVGDMRSVVKAILLDSEALNPPDNAGRLLEPVIALTGLVRAIGGNTDGAYLDSAAMSMQQRPFAAPSVFNFYAPDQALPLAGRTLQAPQFGIVTTATTVARLNAARHLIFTTNIAPDTTLPTSLRSGTSLQWPQAWLTLAINQVPALVDQINLRFAAGTVDAALRNSIVTQVQAMPATTVQQQLTRVRFATFLVFSSPQFMAHK